MKSRNGFWALFGVFAMSAVAGAQEWEKLGSRVVAFHAEHDTIPVTGSEGLFNAIKIDVEDGDIQMLNVKVTFGDGQVWSPDTKIEFNEGSRSRTIDLPGDARVIRKVEFDYRSRVKKGRATVNLYGRRAGGGGGGKETKWERLGSRVVDFKAEKDTIAVTASEGTFNAIRVDVEGGNVEMFNIRVTFGDGEPFSPDTRIEFKEGSWSRVIDLPGAARVIRSVEFWYRSELKRGKATVTLFGRHAGGGAVVVRKEPKDRFPGWEHLGTRVVDFKVDRDTIAVTAREGRFKALQVEVEDGNLELFDIVVTFGNGDKFSPKTRLIFDENSRTRTCDLPGEARIIKQIDFLYKSLKGGGEGKATVHVYGKK